VTVGLIDYRAGNLASVAKAFRYLGAEPRVLSSPAEVANAGALVIPGVGHFAATAALADDWRLAIRARIEGGTAVLGICLGMQWLYEGSDEATHLTGLGWFEGRAEFGPRALGARSILASPLGRYVNENLNHFVKHREKFRPFAASVTAERAGEFFEFHESSRFLASVGRVKPAHRKTFESNLLPDRLADAAEPAAEPTRRYKRRGARVSAIPADRS